MELVNTDRLKKVWQNEKNREKTTLGFKAWLREQVRKYKSMDEMSIWGLDAVDVLRRKGEKVA